MSPVQFFIINVYLESIARDFPAAMCILLPKVGVAPKIFARALRSCTIVLNPPSINPTGNDVLVMKFCWLAYVGWIIIIQEIVLLTS